MKKLRLDLDDLKVETFATTAAPDERRDGTVLALSELISGPDHTCAGSCVDSCQVSCQPSGCVQGGCITLSRDCLTLVGCGHVRS